MLITSPKNTSKKDPFVINNDLKFMIFPDKF